MIKSYTVNNPEQILSIKTVDIITEKTLDIASFNLTAVFIILLIIFILIKIIKKKKIKN